MSQVFAVTVITTGAFAEHPILGLAMVLGIVLCSLLCVMAALRNGGVYLERQSILLLCQVYLVLAALLQLYGAGSRIVGQVAGFLVLALGIAPIFFRKNNFRAARYCIALGATIAACAELLF